MITHQADPPYPGLGHGTLAHLGGFLAEEEVELVIILLRAVWDEVCVDECGVCGREGENMSFAVHVSLHRRRWNVQTLATTRLHYVNNKSVRFLSDPLHSNFNTVILLDFIFFEAVNSSPTLFNPLWLLTDGQQDAASGLI